MTSAETLSNLTQDALLIQNTTVASGSTSVVLQNVSQSLSVDMVASLASRYYNDTQIQNAIGYNILQRQIEIETSFNDLLNSVTQSANTMERLLQDTIGKVIVTIVALLIMGLLVVAAFIKFRPGFVFGGAVGEVYTGG